jgi:hypothetical protein
MLPGLSARPTSHHLGTTGAGQNFRRVHKQHADYRNLTKRIVVVISQSAFFQGKIGRAGVECAPMKKNYLTLVLLVTALAVPAMQSLAMVPSADSLRASRRHERIQPADPNTTVIVSEKTAYYLPTKPPSISYYLPTHPPCAIS